MAKLIGAPKWVRDQGLSAFWDPHKGRLKPGYQGMAGYPGPQVDPAQAHQAGVDAYTASQRQASEGMADARYNASIARSQQLQERAGSDYGYTFDAEGNVTGQTDAASNPYSRANLLQKTYQEGQHLSTAQQASRGHLYGGGTQALLDYQTGEFGRGKHQLQQEFQDRIKDMIYDRSQAGLERSEAYAGAAGQQRQSAFENQYQAQDFPAPQATAVTPAPSRTNLTPAQRRALARRSTGSSRQRYLNRYG